MSIMTIDNLQMSIITIDNLLTQLLLALKDFFLNILLLPTGVAPAR